MSFNNNIPGTPGMPRLMRPKAVSVSPIHSPIGNVIARPVVTVMSSQGHSQYVMGTGIVPQVYPGARVASAQPTSQPRISAQVMLPQQPRVPVQLGTHVSLAQNRNPNMHGFQNVAFQSHFAYPVQRTMSGQVQATNQLLITGRVDPNSNLPVLKPAVPGMQRPFQSQTQQRYMIPAPVNVGKQFISTQNHGIVSSQVSASVLSGSVVHRHTAQIIPQTVVPMRTNQNIHIMAASASTGPLNPSMSVTNVSQSISQAVPYEASVSTIDSIKDTAMNTPAVVSLDTCEPGSSATVLTTSKSCDLPAVENNSAENSIQTEAVMLVDDNCTTTPSEVTTQNMIASQPVLMVENESIVGTENLDGTFVINTSGSSISDESFSYTVTGDQYEHIVINPLSEESSNTNEINQTMISDENSLSLNEASEENRLINDQGNKVEGKNVDDDVNENTEDNAMEVDNENESLDQIHKAVISQSEMDGSSQDSGPALSGKAPSSCVYCSDEDSQFTGVSSDIFTEDSSNMSWEKFHEKVLNLRVNKDRGKISVSDSDQGKQIDVDDEATSVTVDEVVPDDGGKTLEDDNNDEYNDDETEEPDFVWESYLQQVGATAVPPSAFKHVEYSLQSCVMKGMKLEVQNKSDPCTFWVATVVMTCGPLLRLRYDGYGEDSSNDFWCDFATTEIHHIGWSAQNGKNLQPPDEIKDKVEDWRSFLLESLTGARTAPSNFLEKNAGTTPVDQIRCGMMLELQDALNPLHVWLVQVLENVGGRLYLRLEGTQSSCKHFWMFYLNPRLHHVGWANEQSNIIYRAPEDIYKEETDEKWAEILQTALKQNKDEVVPEDVFKDQPELKVHQFAVGMKLEALNPGMNQIGPATVIKVINDNYFIVEMDDVRPAEKRKSIQICCNSEYLGIFPVSWCQCKGIRMVPPPGWTNPDFVWGEYLSFCNAKAAPEKLFTSGTDDHEFERGMKLEAVNPSNPNQICAATITKIVGPLLWIHLDHMRDIPSHIEDIDSHNIFPVGWCESNNYQLKPPLKTKLKQKPVTECKTEQVYRSITSTQEKGAWCPKIYFNHRCFSGPYLSKGRISDLPKHVGPGPMDLVLKEVLRLLISIAYVPCRAMKEIQQEYPPNPFMKSHLLKAKYKGKKYKVMIEVCHNESQLEEFCRNICIKLECCPYLFSPLSVSDNCPENCQQLTKTKSNPSYVKKKKAGNIVSSKPSTAELENREPKKRGRKRKRFLFVQKKGQQYYKSLETQKDSKDEGFIDYDEDDNGIVNGDRRGYSIETRGAKLPKYSFERKTHKKILMTQSNIHVGRQVPGIKKFKPKTWNGEDQVINKLQPREGSIKLESNPLHWSVAEVVQYVKSTDCSHLARIMKEQEVDGQAFLLMNLSAIQEHLELKLGPAVKLCHQIERLKVAFFENYA